MPRGGRRALGRPAASHHVVPAVLALVGLAAAAGSVAGFASPDRCGTGTVTNEVGRVVTGLTFVTAGVIAWYRPGNVRIALLLSGVGISWYIQDLGWICRPLPYTVSRFGNGFFEVLLAHLALAFPDGRLRTRIDRVLMGTIYASFPLIRLGRMAFWEPYGSPRNLLMLRADPRLNDVADLVGGAVALALGLAVVAVLVRHWLTATRPGRRAIALVLWSSVPSTVVVVSVTLWGTGSATPELTPLGLTGLAIGFLVGLMRTGLDHAEVGRLVVELGESPPRSQVRDALARTLHDPSLILAYRVPERGVFVDSTGAAVELPSGAERSVAVLRSGGGPIAALIHDPALDDDPKLIETAAATARLAIENERFQAQIRNRLEDVRRSRARIVEAADEERRRIERNLHDGAQQSLVSVALGLTVVRSRSRATGDERLDGFLAEAGEHVEAAIDELRELARGIYPAILTEAGLGAALESLAMRSPSVHISELPSARPPAAVEAVAYFVVAEALALAAPHGQRSNVVVGARMVGGSLVVELTGDGMRGAESGPGLGLQRISDRVNALDGRLEAAAAPGGGSRMRVTLPCIH